MKTTFKKITKLVGIMLAMALAVSLVGCGVDITSIGLPTNIVMEKGEIQQLTIEYGAKDETTEEKINEAASKLKLEWTSSDEEVATVDETGLVTAVGAGEADITVSVSDANISSTTHVKVVITPTGVEAPDSIELVTNGENSKALGAKMTPEDATEVKLAYESSDESVATVDENGVVTAVADGECVITTYVTADIPLLQRMQKQSLLWMKLLPPKQRLLIPQQIPKPLTMQLPLSRKTLPILRSVLCLMV